MRRVQPTLFLPPKQVRKNRDSKEFKITIAKQEVTRLQKELKAAKKDLGAAEASVPALLAKLKDCTEKLKQEEFRADERRTATRAGRCRPAPPVDLLSLTSPSPLSGLHQADIETKEREAEVAKLKVDGEVAAQQQEAAGETGLKQEADAEVRAPANTPLLLSALAPFDPFALLPDPGQHHQTEEEDPETQRIHQSSAQEQ